MVYIVLFAFGLAVGSFLNVVSLRYRPDRGVFEFSRINGRSHCSHCKRTLRWYELVPLLSYVVLLGRCRTCRARLSLQYPIVEFLGGAAALAIPLFFARFFSVGALFPFRAELTGLYLFSFLWVVVLLIFILISVIDFRHYVIPNELNVFIGVLGVGAVLVKLFLSGSWLLPFSHYFVGSYAILLSPFGGVLANHAAGFAVGGLFFWLIVFVTRGRAMGMGDVKLAAALGLLMGLPDILLVIFFAFLFGGVAGVFTILLGKKTMKSMIPFGPFIVLGALITLFFGQRAIAWYFTLFVG